MPIQPHHSRLLPVVLALLIPLLVGGCRASHPNRPALAETPETDSQADVIRLLNLMGERLALMHEVARWKWSVHKPIADPSRERALLDRVAQLGQARGLDPDFVRRFFAAQIEAGKLIQGDDFGRWQAESPGTGKPRDLALVRQDIDALNERLIASLAGLGPRLAAPETQAILNSQSPHVLALDGIADRSWSIAIAPLRINAIR